METTILNINGMTCSGCTGSVKRVLEAIPGVTSVNVSLEQKQATVQHQSGTTNSAALKAAVEDAGYEVV